MKRWIVGLAVVAGVVLAEHPVEAASGRCPQYEPMLAAYGLPVRTFSHIMWRESRCQPRAVHVNANGSVDRGLLQINSVHLRGVARGVGASGLFRPATNLAVAQRLYRTAGCRPWRVRCG